MAPRFVPLLAYRGGHCFCWRVLSSTRMALRSFWPETGQSRSRSSVRASQASKFLPTEFAGLVKPVVKSSRNTKTLVRST